MSGTIAPEEGCRTRTLKVRFCDAVPAAEQAAGILARDDDSVTVPCAAISMCAMFGAPEEKAEEGGEPRA